jgi:hypothetical protein
MKKTLTVLFGALLASATFATPQLGFNLDLNSEAPVVPVILTDLPDPIAPELAVFESPVSSASVASPIVIPEPATSAILLATGLVCAYRARQKRS